MFGIQSIQQLEAARDEWNALADRAEHALLRHEWFLCAARALHAGSELAIVTVSRHGRLAAVAPLVRTLVNGIERLELIGASTLHEPAGFLYEDAAAHDELIGRLLRTKQPFILQRLPGTSLQAFVAHGIQRRYGILVSRETTPSLSLALVDATNQYCDGLPGKLRYDLKRARARAADAGGLAFEVAAPDEHAVDALFKRLVDIEGSGWKGRHESSLRARGAIGAFFAQYARTTAAQGLLRLFFMRVGDTTVAVQMAVEVYNRLWVLKIGYDERFARCSPGLLLTEAAIRYAIGRRLESYEFLGAAEPWEARWRPEPREHGLVAFYPATVKGWTGASLDAVGATWRRLWSAPRHAS